MSTANKDNAEKPSAPGKGDALLVGPVIKPLAKVKRAHNKLANLVKTAVGKGGIKITVSDSRLTIDATNVTATASNTSELHFSNGLITIDIDAAGIKLANVATGDYVQITPTGSLVMSDASSGNTLTINQADMFYGNYTMREFTICSSGSPANVRMLSSGDY